MVPMAGVLEREDTDCLGRTGREDEETVSPSMSVTSWGAQSSAWEWARSWQTGDGSGLKGGQG